MLFYGECLGSETMKLIMSNLKLYFGMTGVVALSALAYSLTTAEQATSTQKYIMQGASQSTMKAQVEAVGGEITHSFKVIDALSVALTDSQASEISSTNPMLRLFADSQVELNGKKDKVKNNGNNGNNGNGSVNKGWDVDANLTFNFAANNVKWKAKNKTGSNATIQSVEVSWPATNGELKGLLFEGQYFEGNDDGLLTVIPDGKKPLEVRSNGAFDLQMDFEEISSLMESDYSIKVVLEDGEELAMIPYPLDQDSPSPIRYTVDTSHLEWNTLSRATVERTLTQAMIEWPAENGKLLKFKVDGDDILSQPVEGGSAAFDVPKDIIIDPDSMINVELEFEQLMSVADNEYKVLLAFANGSRKTLTSTNSTPQQGEDRDTFYPTIVRANEAHAMGITGDGVAVAIIDSGMQDFKRLTRNNRDDDRITHVYNVRADEKYDEVEDENGHGTHIASVIANNTRTFDQNGTETSSYNSIAPGANLVIVKAFDENGMASYADILAAIEYVVENREALNIKVLNLSFSATPSSNYWEDPINQAVMVAWQAGITVVAAAGNQGPDAMTIGVPGNTPYVITVGAISDNYTPGDINDDFVTRFSSAGPTFEGFVKPEIVAPGGHIMGLMDGNSSISKNYAMYDDQNDYFLLSGSSQSTAITSGIVALMLQNSPTLSPDDIKCRLTYTARTAVNDEGMAFSIFQQGAGLVDAMSALNETIVGCGNAGMDIAVDLAGDDHYIGPARRYENDGDFYIPDQEGFEWNGLYSDAHMWGRVRFTSDAHMWGRVRFNSDAHMWGRVRFISDTYQWADVEFNNDAHMWGRVRFNSDAHMWGRVRFTNDSDLSASSVKTEWVNQE
tara:strand:+ start:111561 stop:114098 length:2538 start_codon:yes stop_codon:yes gene_type:complete